MKYNSYKLYNNYTSYCVVIIVLWLITNIIYVTKTINTTSYKEYRLVENDVRNLYQSKNGYLLLNTREYLTLKHKGYCWNNFHIPIVILITLIHLLFILSESKSYNLNRNKYIIFSIILFNIIIIFAL